jgi:hypothetical protein
VRWLGSWLALSFRLHRWEVLASAAGVAILTVAMLWFTLQLRALTAGEAGCLDPAAVVAGCEQFAQRFGDLSGWGSRLLYVSWGAPFGMGLVLGVPLVSREIEHRTASIAWTLSRSRAWWLARRVAFLALVLIGLLAVVAVASDVLASALQPTLHLDRDFTWYGRRGGLIVVRGLAALGIGVTLGAFIGRLLPAMLAAAFVSVLIFTAVSLGMDRWLAADAVVQPALNGGLLDGSGGRSMGNRIELASGELLTWTDLYRRGFINVQEDQDGRLYASVEDLGHPERAVGLDRMLVVPGRLYPQFVLRESAVVGGLALMLTLAAVGVVGRRRPG